MDFSLILGGILLSANVFGVDLMMPLGVAVGVPYVAVVLLGLVWPGTRYLLVAAAGTSGLTILGFFLGQPDGALWQAVINRFLALFAIWVTAVLGLLYKKSQARKKEVRTCLDFLSRLQSETTLEFEGRALFGHFLHSLLTVTGSGMGFVAEVHRTPEGRPYLKSLAHAARDKGGRGEPKGTTPAPGQEFYGLDPLLDSVLQTGNPVLSNDPSRERRTVSPPEGAPAITAFAGLPLFYGGQILGLVGLANRDSGYDAELVDFLQPFLSACAQSLHALQRAQDQKTAEEELKETRKRLEELSGEGLQARETLEEYRARIEEGDRQRRQTEERLQQVEDALQRAEETVEASDARFHRAEEERQKIEETLERYEMRHRELNEELERMKHALKESEETLDRMVQDQEQEEASLLDLKERYHHAEKERARLEEARLENEDQIRHMREEVVRLQEELKHTRERVEQYSNDRLRAEGNLRILEDQVRRLEEDKKRWEDSCFDLRDRASTLQSEKDRLGTALEEKEALLKQAVDERTRLEETLRRSDDRFGVLEGELSRLNETLRDKEAQVQRLLVDRDGTREALRQAEDRLQRLVEESHRSTEAFQAGQETSHRLEQELQNVRETLAAREDALRREEEERTRLEQRLQEREDRVRQLEQNHQTVEALTRDHEERFRTLEEELKRAEDALIESDARFLQADHERQKMEKRMHEYQERIAALENERQQEEAATRDSEERIRQLEEELKRAEDSLLENDARLLQADHERRKVEKTLHRSQGRLQEVQSEFDRLEEEFHRSRQRLRDLAGETGEAEGGEARPNGPSGTATERPASDREPAFEPPPEEIGETENGRGPDQSPLPATARPSPGIPHDLILEAAAEGICGLDAEGRITFINPAGARMLGYAPQELTGEFQHGRVHHTRPDGSPYSLEDCPIHRTLEDGQVRHVAEDLFWRKDGSRLPVECRCLPIRENETWRGAVVIFSELPRGPESSTDLQQAYGDLERRVEERTRELTEINARLHQEVQERQRFQEKLKLNTQELERSNQDLRDFASIASHDLQEPLRKVVAFSERLKKDFGENLGERAQNYLERMERATQRMQKFIDDLLQFSKVTAKGRPFQPTRLQEVVEDVLTLLETRIARTHGRVDAGDLPTVDADPLQMHQLFQNLIGNALKFHREGVPPVVTIEHRSRGDGFCEITVIDNGIGFDEANLERIFKPFERLHGRSEYEGSGMGLAICRKIVERHGGRLTAQSARMQGSTFTILLPEKQGADEPPPAEKLEENPA